MYTVLVIVTVIVYTVYVHCTSSCGMKGLKKQSSIRMREQVRLPSTVGTISLAFLRMNLILGYRNTKSRNAVIKCQTYMYMSLHNVQIDY